MCDSPEYTASHSATQAAKKYDFCTEGLHAMSEKNVTTRGEIYELAIENFRTSFPQWNPYRYLSSAMNMNESTLRQKVEDSRLHFSVAEEETFFRLTFYPQGLIMKSCLLFGMPMPKQEGQE